ncbi:hypothetical protein [Streptomyces javensis]|uniref:DUF2339 domain-containing protein n=1 Tax=Streptomyces javensis TaxID=114698 RepID=A0ABS0R3N9_9ACTN|nr:hypothetical protein [Streptomyces javensis]MBI0312011.1 hypothetical protein [Streptomyces javensis]
MDANLTILLICLGVLAVVCYAIRRLSSTPARIVAVIMALAALVGALKPLVALLSEPQRAETVAPSEPATPSGPATAPASKQPAATSSASGL